MAAGLLALALAGVLGLVVILVVPGVPQYIGQIMVGTLILVLVLTLVTLLMIAIFDIDIDPFVRKFAVLITGNRVVDFYDLLPEKYEVREVDYKDTDGDGEKEWIVFYRFDLVDGRRPYAGAVYDFDRGDPLALFPYRLLPPDRDYLSESDVRFELKDIVGAGEANPIPELFIYGEVPTAEEAGGKTVTDLTIFRHIPNSFDWEFPRDEPRRYQVIGSFRGDGGVTFDEKDKTVTVRNRAGYDRSQLAVETVYTLDKTRETYMNVSDPEQLGAPISSQVVFAFGMPSDILDTPYPEKLVLGFYETLTEKDPAIKPQAFLTGQALIEYNNNNLTYFGFGDAPGKVSDVKEVTITELSYVPDAEQFNPSVSVLGEEPRYLVVGVTLEGEVGKRGTPQTPIKWVATVINGKWRIVDHYQP
jgi:hypothetical protein